MYPPCEAVGRYILPIFRSLVAKELIEKYSFTQIEAAKRLGTTQAAISQYIHSKRGRKDAKFEGILPRIRVVAKEVAKDIATRETGAEDVMLNFCRLCASLQEKAKATA